MTHRSWFDELPAPVRRLVTFTADGPVVVIPPVVADAVADLVRRELDHLSPSVRPHPAWADLLLAIRAVHTHRSSASGTTSRNRPATGAPFEEMTSTTAAAQLHMTDRGVRKAATEGRLPGHRGPDGTWRFTAADVTEFAARRSNAA